MGMTTAGRGLPSIKRGFVFKSVFGDNPELCGRLLEVALGIEVSEVRVAQPERELEPLGAARGGRLDLYVVDAAGTRYDVEVQARAHRDEWMRARHYQALMDATFLRRGGDARDLPRSVVLFICDFDPFGVGLARYECETVCRQTGQAVPDGRLSVYLNARAAGDNGEGSGLMSFLRFVADGEVDGDPFVGDIVGEIKRRVADPEWLEGYMTFDDELDAERWWALEEGRRQGIEQGREQGRLEVAVALVRDGVMAPADVCERVGVARDALDAALAGAVA